jgi:hypothetical protein
MWRKCLASKSAAAHQSKKIIKININNKKENGEISAAKGENSR